MGENLIVLYTLILVTGVYSTNSSLKLVVVADWGGLPIFPYKTFVELSVGREMAALSSKCGVDVILALGDNFYFNGVTDIDDLRFKETYETAFDYKSLHVPWFVIAGNHDHYGNVSAQIAYSTRSDRWFFPDFYYQKRLKVPFSNVTVDILMIDTVILCGNTDPKHPFEQPFFNGSISKHKQKKHWIWLENALKSSRANYLFVCGHYPVYSIGSHGPTKCLVNQLKPMLEKFQVSAYLSGHDHNIQHIQVENYGQKSDYFISGSGNFIDPSKKHLNEIPPNSLRFHWGNPFSLGAFTYIDINETNMTLSFLKSSGKSIYKYSKGPRYL